MSPGHLFPIMAQPGGVLTRPGHTEAGVDLARLAEIEPASVICEILNPDGTMARLPDLLEFARVHGLKLGTIADLIRYRMRTEPTVWRISENLVSTRHGDFRAVIYEDGELRQVHMALVHGTIEPRAPAMVRVHTNRCAFNMLAEAREAQSWSVDSALERITQFPCGVLVLLTYSEDAVQLDRWVRGGSATDGKERELRMLGAGSQILSDLGAGKVRVLGTPLRTHALSGFGLEVLEYLPDSRAN